MKRGSMWKVSLIESGVSQSAGTTKLVPEKYAKLKQAETAGLAVPKSLLLASEEDQQAAQDEIDNFLASLTNSRFIVRSAHLSEDAGDLSLAGHFWSSGPVVSSEVAHTIKRAHIENSLVLESLQVAEFSVATHVNLILQEYIEHQIGGVLFSPWSFFPDYAYIEYSATGVKAVVEGQNTYRSVLCLNSQYPDLLPLEQTYSELRENLVCLCQKLSLVYDFPIDCEWAYDQNKQRVVVLQVRPQTHLIGPILPYSKLKDVEKSSGDGGLDIIPEPTKQSTNWQFTALSESLGRVSPLSFSLLQQLYIDTIPMLQQLGCKAETFDFMSLAPDGTVLVDPELEKRFYSMTLFGGFQRGMQQSKLVTDASLKMREYDKSAPFSYQTLQQLFTYWMAANLLSSGKGRSGSAVTTEPDPTHAYELSWPAELETPEPASLLNDQADYETLNAVGRLLFLFELNKLKIQLSQKFKTEMRQAKRVDQQAEPQQLGHLYFYTWDELQSGEINSQGMKSAKERQHKLARFALYDYALSGAENSSEVQALSSTKSVQGQLLIIENPANTHEAMAANHILLATYFDNRWVGKIKRLKGIVVKQGSRLSHSAIVAREYGVPYYVVPDLKLKKKDQGRLVILDPESVTNL